MSGQVLANSSHSVGDYKNAKTHRQCMYFDWKKLNFPFFEIPIVFGIAVLTGPQSEMSSIGLCGQCTLVLWPVYILSRQNVQRRVQITWQVHFRVPIESQRTVIISLSRERTAAELADPSFFTDKSIYRWVPLNPNKQHQVKILRFWQIGTLLLGKGCPSKRPHRDDYEPVGGSRSVRTNNTKWKSFKFQISVQNNIYMWWYPEDFEKPVILICVRIKRDPPVLLCTVKRFGQTTHTLIGHSCVLDFGQRSEPIRGGGALEHFSTKTCF